VDLFRVESIVLQTHWVMVVLDLYTRRIIGLAVNRGSVSGENLCRMFNEILVDKHPPKYLSRDCDPLFRFERWKINMDICHIDEVKGVPEVPISRPFVERLIGTVRQEFLDEVLFWNRADLEQKLHGFQQYYNDARVHYSLDGCSPSQKSGELDATVASPADLKWRIYCRGLYSVPMAA
jgi:transposase InsO family protein